MTRKNARVIFVPASLLRGSKFPCQIWSLALIVNRARRPLSAKSSVYRVPSVIADGGSAHEIRGHLSRLSRRFDLASARPLHVKGKRWVAKNGANFGLMNGMGSAGREYVPGQIHRSDRMASTGLYDDGRKGIRRLYDPAQ